MFSLKNPPCISLHYPITAVLVLYYVTARSQSIYCTDVLR